MKKTYEFTSKDKVIKVTYEYEKVVFEDIRDMDGYELSFGKKVVEHKSCTVHVNGKFVCNGTPRTITEDNIKHYVSGAKVGMLNIGELYIQDTNKISDIMNMIAECIAEGTTLEANELERQEKAAESKPTTTTHDSNLCPICHSYCYGDCTASKH